jgi:large subunit ribosomal protein L3
LKSWASPSFSFANSTRNMKFILGKKIGMTQIFNEEGSAVAVTLVEAGPVEVTQVKNLEKDGYDAIQVGYGKITKQSLLKKPMKGKEFKTLKEYAGDVNETKVGDVFDVSIFEEGDVVKVSGISKGKGFQGGVKRHGFAGKDRTHGVKHEHRTIGSIGSAYPQRVIKGRKMPGHDGAARRTVKNLKIMKVEKDTNIIAISGALVGRRGTLLEITCE